MMFCKQGSGGARADYLLGWLSMSNHSNHPISRVIVKPSYLHSLEYMATSLLLITSTFSTQHQGLCSGSSPRSRAGWYEFGENHPHPGTACQYACYQSNFINCMANLERLVLGVNATVPFPVKHYQWLSVYSSEEPSEFLQIICHFECLTVFGQYMVPVYKKKKSSGLFLLLAVGLLVMTCEWVNDDSIPLKPGRNDMMTEDDLIKACSPTERNRTTSELKISPRSVSLSRDEIAAPPRDWRGAALWRQCEMWPWFALIIPLSPPWRMCATLSDFRSFQTAAYT